MTVLHTLLELLEQLVASDSTTPDQSGCQDDIARFLQKLGFECQRWHTQGVENLIATYGSGAPYYAFVGHSDVVPSGDHVLWHNSPFQLQDLPDRVVGRGVCDMKGAIACALQAVEQFLQQHSIEQGTLLFLITGDEEGRAEHGMRAIMTRLKEQGIDLDGAFIGEPTSVECSGDTVKVGRRGSLSAAVTLQGQQGHVAYDQQNPIHDFLPAMAWLAQYPWPEAAGVFPKASCHITYVHADGGASNVIPGQCVCRFNIRYPPDCDISYHQQLITERFQAQGSCEFKWHHSAHPFGGEPGPMATACAQAVSQSQVITPVYSTSGGTSDGRFLAAEGVDVAELGLVNTSAHQVNEWMLKTDLEALASIYLQVFKVLFL